MAEPKLGAGNAHMSSRVESTSEQATAQARSRLAFDSHGTTRHDTTHDPSNEKLRDWPALEADTARKATEAFGGPAASGETDESSVARPGTLGGDERANNAPPHRAIGPRLPQPPLQGNTAAGHSTTWRLRLRGGGESEDDEEDCWGYSGRRHRDDDDSAETRSSSHSRSRSRSPSQSSSSSSSESEAQGWLKQSEEHWCRAEALEDQKSDLAYEGDQAAEECCDSAAWFLRKLSRKLFLKAAKSSTALSVDEENALQWEADGSRCLCGACYAECGCQRFIERDRSVSLCYGCDSIRTLCDCEEFDSDGGEASYGH
jgi:hypothetical protein